MMLSVMYLKSKYSGLKASSDIYWPWQAILNKLLNIPDLFFKWSNKTLHIVVIKTKLDGLHSV